ncbi:CHAT domain-containing protein [Desulfobacterales bacterium HSG2]|nr:CHAT domain-containing protein [Desulfobacterales bacterium HSG2]
MNNRLLLSFLFVLCLFPFHIPEEGVVWAESGMAGETGAADEWIDKGKELYNKGDFEHAALAWEQAAALLITEQKTGVYLDTLMHLAGAYQSLGYHRRGISVLSDALPVVERSDDLYRNVLFFSTLGDLNLSLGDAGEAVTYLLRGFEEAGKTENPRVMATILNNVGNGLAADRDYGAAAAVYDQCLELVGDSEENADLKSKVLLNFLRLEFQKGNYKEIAGLLNNVLLEIGSTPDTYEKASNLITLSLLARKVQKKLPRPDSDLTYTAYITLDDAKRIGETLQDPRIISYSFGYMGQLYEDEKRYSDAIKMTRRAIFFAQQGKFPGILYLWQWQLGRVFRDQGDTKKAMKAYGDAISTLTPIRQELFQGYRSKEDTFNESIKPVYLGLTDLLLKQAETIQDGEARKKKLIEARDTMEILKTAELEDFFADECVAAMKFEKTTLERTPPNTAVLYPITLPDHLALLVTLPDGIRYFSIPTGSDKIKETVTQYRKRLQTRPNNRFLYGSQQLYDWIIRPIEAELTAQKVHTLLVAPDGALRLIPFSTLHDGEHFLIEKYAIGTIPAISLTNPEPFDKENINILMGGLSEGRQGFSPLPSVTAELRDIKEIMGAKVLIQNKDYTIDNLTSEFKKEAYSILHVATHGVFGGTPDQSFLLAYENKLTMDRLEDLIGLSRFREKKVELLTLSACQTALGDERAALGLAGVAVKAGVKGAIATLWFVDDEATSVAIREFYRQLKKPGLSKAQAMQNVQKKLIAQRRYWHPLYWAPFLVIGNWL